MKSTRDKDTLFCILLFRILPVVSWERKIRSWYQKKLYCTYAVVPENQPALTD